MPVGARPRVPEGFSVELVASGLAQPRAIPATPNGGLFVANSSANEVRVYRIPSGSSKPTVSGVFAAGLHQPYGIAFYPPGPDPQWMYIANSRSVVRFPNKNGDLKTTAKPEGIVECIPATHHWIRDVLFTPDGKRLLVTVASGSNAALDMFPAPQVAGGIDGWNKAHPPGAAWDSEEGRVNILSFNPDGTDEKIYATGIRNPAGNTIQPATGQLWAVVNERDGLGDNTPFDYATYVHEGAFYGWPWFYIGGHEDPRHKGEHTDLQGRVTVPDVLIQAHSAPLQIVFYKGEDFPAEYEGSAFVTRMVPGTDRSGLAIKLSTYSSIRVASRRGSMRILRQDSSFPINRCGAAPWELQSQGTARSSSRRMGTERFGAFLERGQLSTNFIHSEAYRDSEIPTARAVCTPSPTAMNGVDLNWWAFNVSENQRASLALHSHD